MVALCDLWGLLVYNLRPALRKLYLQALKQLLRLSLMYSLRYLHLNV